MTPEKDKVKCKECSWDGRVKDLDRVTDPRPLPDTTPDNWMVCPLCRTPENIAPVCDEPGCSREVSCGWVATGGYRNTCSKHYVSPMRGL